MQTPTTSVSSEVDIRLGTYLHARLAAHPATAPLATLVKTRTDELQATMRVREDKAQVLLVTEAAADAAEEEVELTVKALGDDLYNAAGRDRSAPRFARLSPSGFAVFTQPRRQDQVDVVGRLLRRMEALVDEPLVPVHRPKIEAALAGLTAALGPVTEAAADLERARTAEYLARAAFVATYVSTYGAVLATLGTKAAAEKFFLRYRAEAAPAEPETTPDA